MKTTFKADKAIRIAMAENGMTGLQLSIETGIAMSQMSQIRTVANPNPTVGTMLAVSNALKIPFNQLISYGEISDAQ